MTVSKEELKEYLLQTVESGYKSDIEKYKKALKEYKDMSITDIMEIKTFEIQSIANGYAALALSSNIKKGNIYNLGDVYDLSCLLSHYYLLSNLLTNLFEIAEGYCCSADKAHTVLHYLIKKFSGKPTPDLKKDAFYNPEIIFREEWEILEFFEAFKQFTYGKPKNFLKLYDRLEKEAWTHNERAAKRLLLNYFKEKYPTAIIVNEYNNMSWKRRADFLIVLENEIYIVEIKSRRDNLSRLKEQVEFFSKNADKVILYLDEKHANSVPELQYDNLEGFFYSFDGSRMSMRKFQEPANAVSPPMDSLLQHWRLKELRLLFKGVIPKLYRKTVEELREELSKYPYETVKKLTCGLLRERYKAYNGRELKSRKGDYDEPERYESFFVKAKDILQERKQK